MGSFRGLTLSSDRLVRILSFSCNLRSSRPYLLSYCSFNVNQIPHRCLTNGNQTLYQQAKPSQESKLAPSKSDGSGGSLQTSFAQKSKMVTHIYMAWLYLYICCFPAPKFGANRWEKNNTFLGGYVIYC